MIPDEAFSFVGRYMNETHQEKILNAENPEKGLCKLTQHMGKFIWQQVSACCKPVGLFYYWQGMFQVNSFSYYPVAAFCMRRTFRAALKGVSWLLLEHGSFCIPQFCTLLPQLLKEKCQQSQWNISSYNQITF